MPFEGRQRAAILNRCWSIYSALTRTFNISESFHVEFPVTAESALMSGMLNVTVPLAHGLNMMLREEYDFDRQQLTVSRYSYNLIDGAGNNLFRADNLPRHRTDYRRRPLTNPPHHSHDHNGRVVLSPAM